MAHIKCKCYQPYCTLSHEDVKHGAYWACDNDGCCELYTKPDVVKGKPISDACVYSASRYIEFEKDYKNYQFEESNYGYFLTLSLGKKVYTGIEYLEIDGEVLVGNYDDLPEEQKGW